MCSGFSSSLLTLRWKALDHLVAIQKTTLCSIFWANCREMPLFKAALQAAGACYSTPTASLVPTQAKIAGGGVHVTSCVTTL
mmetsp:Transcript_38897/g.77190  ORF Transcript_38897/g.77190 Transcript_38897/m.77190 type:complete len:82 (+) Transcript_38897:41-286(+)